MSQHELDLPKKVPVGDINVRDRFRPEEIRIRIEAKLYCPEELFLDPGPDPGQEPPCGTFSRNQGPAIRTIEDCPIA